MYIYNIYIYNVLCIYLYMFVYTTYLCIIYNTYMFAYVYIQENGAEKEGGCGHKKERRTEWGGAGLE